MWKNRREQELRVEKLEEALMKKFMLPICALGRINEYENKF